MNGLIESRIFKRRRAKPQTIVATYERYFSGMDFSWPAYISHILWRTVRGHSYCFQAFVTLPTSTLTDTTVIRLIKINY